MLPGDCEYFDLHNSNTKEINFVHKTPRQQPHLNTLKYWSTFFGTQNICLATKYTQKIFQPLGSEHIILTNITTYMHHF